MNDRLLVRCLQTLRHLDAHANRFFERNRTGGDPLGEGRPFDQLQHQRPNPVRLLETVDRGDVRMVERGEDAGLPLEALHSLFIAGEGFGQDLDGHLALQLRIVRAVHLTHPARAQGREQLVGPHPGSGKAGS